MARIIRKFDVNVPKLDAIGRALVAEPLNWKVAKVAPQSRTCSAKAPSTKVTARKKVNASNSARNAR